MGHRHVFLVSLALLLVATTHAGAEGHATQAPAAAAAAAAITQQGTDDGVVGGGSMIGSRPPNCTGRCGWWCVGRSCEAMAVPVQPPPQEQLMDNKQSRRHGTGSAGGGDDDGRRASPAAQRPYDDSDHPKDYEPIVWRCKCVG